MLNKLIFLFKPVESHSSFVPSPLNWLLEPLHNSFPSASAGERRSYPGENNNDDLSLPHIQKEGGKSCIMNVFRKKGGGPKTRYTFYHEGT